MYVIHSSIVTLVVVSFIVSLLSTLVMKFTVDKHKMRSIKERMEKLKKKLKDEKYKSDPEKMNALMKEQYGLMSEQLRISMKGTFISIAFLIPFYYYLSSSLGSERFALPFYVPFLGTEASWLVLYIFYTILFSVILKKILGVDF